jgi:hypothetical protein
MCGVSTYLECQTCYCKAPVQPMELSPRRFAHLYSICRHGGHFPACPLLVTSNSTPSFTGPTGGWSHVPPPCSRAGSSGTACLTCWRQTEGLSLCQKDGLRFVDPWGSSIASPQPIIRRRMVFSNIFIGSWRTPSVLCYRRRTESGIFCRPCLAHELPLKTTDECRLLMLCFVGLCSSLFKTDFFSFSSHCLSVNGHTPMLCQRCPPPFLLQTLRMFAATL